MSNFKMRKSDVRIKLFIFPRGLTITLMLLCLHLVQPSSTCEFDWECPVNACCMAYFGTFYRWSRKCVYHYGQISVCSRPRHCGLQTKQGCGSYPFRCFNYNAFLHRYGVCLATQSSNDGNELVSSGAGPDPCDRCQNGAACDRDLDSVVCICPVGFTGLYCQFRSNQVFRFSSSESGDDD